MRHVSFLDLISRSEDIDRRRRLPTQTCRFLHLNEILYLRDLFKDPGVETMLWLQILAGVPCNKK